MTCRACLLLLVLAIAPLGAASLERLPNTTLKVPNTAPALGYTTENAFGNLSFTDPVSIKSPPGETNRLFVVEQAGRVYAITNLAAPNKTLFLDISDRVSGGQPFDERGLLGLAFHPGYASNGHFFVFYTGNATTGGSTSLHDILARFETDPENPNAGNPGSEVRLIAQRDEAANHNAGDLHFGPDGYLYVALGDEGGGNDSYNNSQTITKDFFSGLIRIDVDKRPGSLPPNSHPAVVGNYSVPPSNPFVDATSFNGRDIDPSTVRTEFWAVGLRNPWRFSFDPLTGDLWCADVGQGAWEEINLITRGGNYGWAYREGRQPGPKTAPADFSHIEPVYQYGHGSGPNQGFSVTGGVVYRGNRLTQLAGAYVFADYVSGNVWAFRYQSGEARDVTRLTGLNGIAGFGVDPSNGDVLMASQNLDSIRRLVYSTNTTGTPLPPTLADTGAFADLTTLAPHAGIVPYTVNTPYWSDGAEKKRWFSIPDPRLAMGFNPEGAWSFPTGAVWIQHFELELTNGVPESKRRLETRFLLRNDTGVFGLTYRWDGAQTNAFLVPETGLNETLLVTDTTGLVRTQIWRYPSRQECNICHRPAGGLILGFNTPQLNRSMNYNGEATNQIAALSHAGYFSNVVSGAVLRTLPAMTHPADSTASLETRVRSYLSANCMQCHQPEGIPQSFWDARFTTPTIDAGIVNGPLVNNRGNPNARVVKPGSLADSEILQRISILGPGRMPPVGSTVPDAEGIALLSAWITNDLPDWQTLADWQLAHFGNPGSPDAAPEADPDNDLAPNVLEFLAGTDPNDSSSAWKPGIRRAAGAVELLIPRVANRAFEAQSTTNLLDPGSWVPLDVPGNEPLFPSTPGSAQLVDQETATNKFYRLRMFRP